VYLVLFSGLVQTFKITAARSGCRVAVGVRDLVGVKVGGTGVCVGIKVAVGRRVAVSVGNGDGDAVGLGGIAVGASVRIGVFASVTDGAGWVWVGMVFALPQPARRLPVMASKATILTAYVVVILIVCRILLVKWIFGGGLYRVIQNLIINFIFRFCATHNLLQGLDTPPISFTVVFGLDNYPYSGKDRLYSRNRTMKANARALPLSPYFELHYYKLLVQK